MCTLQIYPAGGSIDPFFVLLLFVFFALKGLVQRGQLRSRSGEVGQKTQRNTSSFSK